LESTVQKQMSETPGQDFSGVRVHKDKETDELNQQLSARAFTTGRDIFFKQGEYNPGTSRGRELIAHELSHVVQQSSGRASGGGSGMTIRPAGDAFEQEADVLAHEAASRASEAGSQVEGGGAHRPDQKAQLESQLTGMLRFQNTNDNRPTRIVVQRASYERMRNAFSVTDEQVDRKIAEIGAEDKTEIGPIFEQLCSYGRTNFTYGGGSRLRDVIDDNKFTCETLSSLLIVIYLRLHGDGAAKIERKGEPLLTKDLTDEVENRGMIPGPNVQGTNRYAFGQGHQVAAIQGQEYDPLLGLQALSILENPSILIEGQFLGEGRLKFIVSGRERIITSDGTKVNGLTQWKVLA
jgi:hypothetical protein